MDLELLPGVLQQSVTPFMPRTERTDVLARLRASAKPLSVHAAQLELWPANPRPTTHVSTKHEVGNVVLIEYPSFLVIDAAKC